MHCPHDFGQKALTYATPHLLMAPCCQLNRVQVLTHLPPIKPLQAGCDIFSLDSLCGSLSTAPIPRREIPFPQNAEL